MTLFTFNKFNNKLSLVKKSKIWLGVQLLIMLLLTGCPGAIDSITSKDLGQGYIYHEQIGLPTISNVCGKGINGVVFDYDYNNEFIVALEKACMLSDKEEEKLILNGDFYNYLLHNGYSKYWIIVHSNDSIYGPFSKQEYLQRKKELGLTEDLKLR
jgi:hypothetical protein